jgi:hypothetical protein
MAYFIFSRYWLFLHKYILATRCIPFDYNLCLYSQEPNYEDPLNHDAAAVLRDNPKLFESNVRRAMAGGYVGQTLFPRCL